MQITPGRRRKLGQLEARLGIRFKNLGLLNQALTHSSYAQPKGKKGFFDYERLEFLLLQKGKMHEINDFKSYLQEYVQSKYKSLPRYKVVQEAGPDHQKKFRVEVEIRGKLMGKGWGLSKKKAEMMAARLAWKRIGTTEGPAQKK